MEFEEKLPFTEHLEELRRRIMIVLGTVFGVFLVTFSFSDKILEFFQKPIQEDLVFTAPTEAFMVQMKVAFLVAVAISIPVILFQAWEFISPGLLEKEKQFTLPFVLISTFFFFGGMAFCFYVVLPLGLKFLINYGGDMIRPMISVGNYVSFLIKMMIAFGFVFEIPVLIPLGVKIGIVTPAQLSRWRKYMIVVNFIVAAILTPSPDVVSQCAMGVPLCLLYEVGLLVGKIVYKRKTAKETPAEEEDETVSVS